MKIHWHCSIGGQQIVSWYDPKYGWVAARQTERGEQIGDAEYCGHKSALASGVESLIRHAVADSERAIADEKAARGMRA